MSETPETLAKQLTNCADTISNRLNADVKAGKVTAEQANKIIGKIAVLRQQANAMYMESVIDALANQADAQKKLQGAITKANDKIKTLQNVAKVLDLAVDVINFAAKAYSGDAVGILNSIIKLRADVDNF